jgi:GNAT superfamily N-acetyltransferase
MIVRLHNLSARYPILRDAAAVAELLRTREGDDTVLGELTEETIARSWHTDNFHLKTDSWVIVTKQGHIVGYAEVRLSEDGQFTMLAHVHPDYQRRGIGTLLIWLVEERARQQMLDISANTRVALKTTINSLNQYAHQLLEHEGYARVHSFWRLLIDMEHIAEQAYSGKLRVDMVVDTHTAHTRNSASHTHVLQPTGMYVAHQYSVYEKELRAPGACPECTDERESLAV